LEWNSNTTIILPKQGQVGAKTFFLSFVVMGSGQIFLTQVRSGFEKIFLKIPNLFKFFSLWDRTELVGLGQKVPGSGLLKARVGSGPISIKDYDMINIECLCPCRLCRKILHSTCIPDSDIESFCYLQKMRFIISL